MHASKFTKFKFIVRDARVYLHNSSSFFATPQMYVAADKNKIYSPVLSFTNVYFYKAVPTLTKQSPIGKQNLSTRILLLFYQFALYKPRNTYK